MRPASSNSMNALATDDWFGMRSIRIQRPSTRIWMTALNDCEPPLTCITASVFSCVGGQHRRIGESSRSAIS